MKNKTNKIFRIFKIEYDWYEGEHGETFLGKYVEKEEFEKDLFKAKQFAKSLIGKRVKNYDYLGKGYSVECLPEYYGQIIWFLINKKGYTECYIEEDSTYKIEDHYRKRIIEVIKMDKKIESHELKAVKKSRKIK